MVRAAVKKPGCPSAICLIFFTEYVSFTLLANGAKTITYERIFRFIEHSSRYHRKPLINHKLVGRVGLEPTTNSLKGNCSTN